MNGRVARQLKRRAEDQTTGLPEKLYKSGDPKTGVAPYTWLVDQRRNVINYGTPNVTVELDHCTRRVYQQLKKNYYNNQ